MRIVLGQFNATVGALKENSERILALAQEAKSKHKADLLILPEMCLCGYPAQDLWQDIQFIRACEKQLEELISQLPKLAVIIGYPRLAQDPQGDKKGKKGQGLIGGRSETSEALGVPQTHFGRIATNHADVWDGGKRIASYAKQVLPNYSVFDEKRYFVEGTDSAIFTLNGMRFGLLICEDLWRPDPIAACRAAGAQHIIGINASPYHRGQISMRRQLVCTRAKEAGLPISYINTWGGQDGLIFDGNSFVCDKKGEIVATLSGMQAGLLVTELATDGSPQPAAASAKAATASKQMSSGQSAGDTEDLAEVYAALTLGLSDYAAKNGFERAVLGLSGGIDSALSLCVAADALGAKKVTAFALPSAWTSPESLRYAAETAKLLGTDYQEISIEPVTEGVHGAMTSILKDETETGITLQNIQARSRALMLMVWANRNNALLLATGNKSEFAVGYSTLYGDMAGGFCPLIDVFKTDVYALSRFRNSKSPAIPDFIIEREPSAELYAGQKDSDNLPSYEVLDGILKSYLEEGLEEEEIVKRGYAKSTVRRIVRMVYAAEHKRFQAAVGTRISLRAYGSDRRYPITNGYLRA